MSLEKCRGSFQLGTACGLCDRCKGRGFTPAQKNLAIAKEEERTKNLPPDRVKPKNQVIIKN